MQAISLDIQSAYDNVYLPILRQRLIELALPQSLISVIFNLMTRRSIQFSSSFQNNTTRITSRGLPQGSSLSTLLFAIYLSDVESYIKHPMRILLYADDILLYSVFPSGELTANTLFQEQMDRLQTYIFQKGFTLNPSKSQWIIFSRRRIEGNMLLKVQDQTIRPQKR